MLIELNHLYFIPYLMTKAVVLGGSRYEFMK